MAIYSLHLGEKEEVLDRELAAARRAGLTEVEKLVMRSTFVF